MDIPTQTNGQGQEAMLKRFPEFMPDEPDLLNEGLTVAKNVIPGGSSYYPVPDFTEFSDALDSAPLGAFATRDAETGVAYNFAGTATKLYVLGKTTTSIWDDITRTSADYNSGDNWSITQFQDEVIATNFADEIQKYQLGVDSNFSNLDSTAPRARYAATVHNDFLVVANTYDTTDGYVPYRVRWPGIGSSTSWTVSATNQADYQDLDSRWGWINQIISGEYGTIFQENAITRMDYVGSPTVFQFQTVETNQGTKFPNSCVRVGSFIYFIGLDGFRVFNGSHSEQIGNRKVNKFFTDDVATVLPETIRTAVDYDNHIIIWGYQSSENGSSFPINRIIFFNYAPNAINRWGYADFPNASGSAGGFNLIFTALTEGYTLDGLDEYQSAIQGITPNIDLLPYSLDSRFWTGNQIKFGAFKGNKMAFPGSTYLDATIDTAEFQLSDGRVADLLLARPAVSRIPTNSVGSISLKMQVGTRNFEISDVSWTTTVSANATGNFEFRANGRYHRLRTIISGGFKHAIGVEILEYKDGGNR